MNLFHFIDSKDIREHLRQIGYSFTAPEAAFLVWRCRNADLKEKFAAWQEMIETMPDCSLTREKEEPIENCHEFLRRHIASQETLLREFPDGMNCVYRYETREPQRWPQDDGWRGGGEYFSSFDSCLSHCLRRLDEDMQTDRIRFYRQEWCGGNYSIQWLLETDREKNPIYVNRYGIPGGDELTDTDDIFSDMWFAFPTPFRRGRPGLGSIPWHGCPFCTELFEYLGYPRDDTARAFPRRDICRIGARCRQTGASVPQNRLCHGHGCLWVWLEGRVWHLGRIRRMGKLPGSGILPFHAEGERPDIRAGERISERKLRSGAVVEQLYCPAAGEHSYRTGKSLSG